MTEKNEVNSVIMSKN